MIAYQFNGMQFFSTERLARGGAAMVDEQKASGLARMDMDSMCVALDRQACWLLTTETANGTEYPI